MARNQVQKILRSGGFYPSRWRKSFAIQRPSPTHKRPVAGVAKLVDAPDLGSGAARRGGSSPSTRTNTTSFHQCDLSLANLRGSNAVAGHKHVDGLQCDLVDFVLVKSILDTERRAAP